MEHISGAGAEATGALKHKAIGVNERVLGVGHPDRRRYKDEDGQRTSDHGVDLVCESAA